MSSRQVVLFALSIASWVCACDGGDPVATQAHGSNGGHRANDDDDAGAEQTQDAAVAHKDAAAPASNGNSGGAFEPPENDSYERARLVEVGGDTMQRVVNEKQVDYYSFEAKAGGYYVISTDRSSFSPDNVLTVFDQDHSMVAENDRGSLYPNDTVDARVILRTERAGTYYVTAEDRVLPGGDTEGHYIPPLFYRLSLREITADSAGYAMEADDDAPKALVLEHETKSQTHYVTLLGNLSDDDHKDTFELQGMLDYALIGKLLIPGVEVRIVAESDGHLVANCGPESGQSNIHPPVNDEKYRIEVTGDGKSDKGFYAVDIVLLRDNPHERTDAENNNLDAAEPITLSPGGTRRGLLLSRLPAKDVDHYRFDAEAGDLVAVNCEGESGGSGVRGLKAEVLGVDKKPLMAASEASPKPLLLKPFELMQSGTYYLKLSSETPPADDKTVEPWVRCAVLLGR